MQTEQWKLILLFKLSEAINSYWKFIAIETDLNESKEIIKNMYTAALVVSIISTAFVINYFLSRSTKKIIDSSAKDKPKDEDISNPQELEKLREEVRNEVRKIIDLKK